MEDRGWFEIGSVFCMFTSPQWPGRGQDDKLFKQTPQKVSGIVEGSGVFKRRKALETLMRRVGRPDFHTLCSVAISQIVCHWSASDRVFLNLVTDDDALYDHET